MRQGQQNRRGRGRSGGGGNNNHNNHRKGQNPLTRSFESTGPDMKIRGTPAHIAEKYVALARDAQSSGDPVLAENYLQHAEHYNRIILAYREQQMMQGGDHQNGQALRHQQPGVADFSGRGDDFGDDDLEGFTGDQPSPAPARQQEQQHRPYESSRFDDRQQRNRQDYQRPHRDRHDQSGNRGGFDRPERRERAVSSDQPAIDTPQPALGAQGDNQPRKRERFVPQHEQPEFLRRPVRRPRREGPAEEQVAETTEAADVAADETGRE